MVDTTADFLDKFEEDGRVNKDDLEVMQKKIIEFGMLVHPVSGSSSRASERQTAHTRASQDSAQSSVQSEFIQLQLGKKKKKVRKKQKITFDYNMIGLDLTSMMVEIQTELVARSSADSGSQSNSIESELAAQSSIQGCLLLKALRSVILISEEEQSSPIVLDSLIGSDVSFSASPQSYGDKIVSAMASGDILSITSVVGSVAPAIPLITSYLSAVKTATFVAEDASLPETTTLLTAIKNSRQFIEEYISLVATMCTTTAGLLYLMQSESGQEIITAIATLLLQLQPTKTDVMVKLHLVCISTIMQVSNNYASVRLVFVNKGGVQWLASTLEGLYNDATVKLMPSAPDYLDLCVGLLSILLQDSDCRNYLLGSEYESELLSISLVLITALTSSVSALKEGRNRELRATEINPEDILPHLLDNANILKAIKESSEFNTLKSFIESDELSNNVGTLDSIKRLVTRIDLSMESDFKAKSLENYTILGELYLNGIKNLVAQMLKTLSQNPEVEEYSKNNLVYSTDRHVLEKYKQSHLVHTIPEDA